VSVGLILNSVTSLSEEMSRYGPGVKLVPEMSRGIDCVHKDLVLFAFPLSLQTVAFANLLTSTTFSTTITMGRCSCALLLMAGVISGSTESLPRDSDSLETHVRRAGSDKDSVGAAPASRRYPYLAALDCSFVDEPGFSGQNVRSTATCVR
jgi:hypothetical protein